MTQCNTLNVTLSNFQLNKFKSAIKNGTELSLNLSPNINGDSNDENNFSHKLLLTNTQVSKLRKTCANNYSANIKLTKTQLHKSLLIPLGLTTAASATGATVHKKMFESGFTTLVTSNEEMEDIMKIVKSPEGSGLLVRGVSEAIKNNKRKRKSEAKEQKGTLDASLLENLLISKCKIRAGEGTIRAGEKF